VWKRVAAMVDKVVIGNATLYHGDCLEVLPTLSLVDCVITDPPYGHNNNNNDLIHRWEEALGVGKSPDEAARPIANDGPEANELFKAALPMLHSIMRPGSCCCCCCGGGPDPQFARWSLWMDEVFDFKQMVVWDKGPMGMGWHYRRSYETVLVAQKAGAACNWQADKQDVENIIRPGQYGIRKIIPQAHDHPTPKPVALASHFIGLHSKAGETVLDPFMGRGWVGQAASAMGRRFIGIEIDCEHFDHACERIENAQRQESLFHTEQPTPVRQDDLLSTR